MGRNENQDQAVCEVPTTNVTALDALIDKLPPVGLAALAFMGNMLYEMPDLIGKRATAALEGLAEVGPDAQEWRDLLQALLWERHSGD